MNLDALVADAASLYNLSPVLLKGQVLVESAGDPNAFRFEHDFFTCYVLGNGKAKAAQYGPLAACSYGLMQIMLETAVEIGYTNAPWELFQPAVGLNWGACYLRRLIDRARGDVSQALAAYNGGTRGNLIKPYRNQAYIDKVYRAAGI